jgi:hypothetical protein
MASRSYKSAEQLVSEVLESDERLLWSGRPKVEAVMTQQAQARRRSTAIALACMAIAVLWLAPDYVYEGLPVLLEEEPKLRFALAAPFVLIGLVYAFGLDNQTRLRRYFESLSYGLTNKRLLILEGQRLTAYSPEQILSPRIRERSNGYADVIVDELPDPDTDTGRSRDPVRRERRRIGFKVQPHAAQLAARIESWIGEYLHDAARSVGDFVQAAAAERTSGNHGLRQICIVSAWPESSRQLQRAVESVIELVRVG